MDIQVLLLHGIQVPRLELLLFKEDLAVFHLLDDVGVGVLNGHHGALPAPGHRHLDVEVGHALNEAALTKALCLQPLHFLHVLGRHYVEHLQLQVASAADYAHHRCRINALPAAGIGHCHTLHVFHDVAAAIYLHVLRHPAQQSAGQRGGVSHGDGLGTSHGRTKFMLQDLTDPLALLLVHVMSSFLFPYSREAGYALPPLPSLLTCRSGSCRPGFRSYYKERTENWQLIASTRRENSSFSHAQAPR